MSESYVTNCLIEPRPDQEGQMFYDDGGDRLIVKLDRYAIVPREKYESLLDENQELRKRKEDDEHNFLFSRL
jgi:hypothetical protein